MRLTITLLFSLCITFLQAQTNCTSPTALVKLEGNNISAMMTNGGDLFWDGFGAQFIAPAQDSVEVATIFATGLWLGGLDPGGNLKVAAQTYGRYLGTTDYIAGPLQPNMGLPYDQACLQFDKIWTVNRQTIIDHLNDWNDNGIIDAPNDAIYSWPGKGNAHFESYNAFSWPTGSNASAPFWDIDGDGIYEPESGEYPHYSSIADGLIPEMMTWSIFNDVVTHTQSNGEALQTEIQLLSWNFNCSDNEILNNTIFTAHKISNHSIENINDLKVSFWVDFDLGCFTDDYVGSSPNRNAFFVYNRDSIDGLGNTSQCDAGVNAYGDHPPVQSIVFLNQSLDYMTHYDNALDGVPTTASPGSPSEFFNYMSGKWRDGTPMIEGGYGYDPNGGIAINHAFPGDPNNPDEWSMYSNSLSSRDQVVVASHDAGLLQPGASVTLESAYTFHREDGAGHLENVTKMYSDIDALQAMYDNQFEGVCQSLVLSTPTLIPDAAFSLSPNPTTGHIDLQLHDLELDRLKVFDLQGRMLMEWSDLSGSMDIDLSGLSAGMYLVRLESAGSVATRKVVRL